MGTKPRMGREQQYLCLHHVHPPRPQLPHAVIDVNHAFPFRHVQHDIDHDETARPPCASTRRKEDSSAKEKGPLCFSLLYIFAVVRVIAYKMSHSEACSLVAFSTFTMLCDHHLYQVPKRCQHPKGAPVPPARCASFERRRALCLPAVHHQWACVGWALGFNLPDEPQQPRGMIGDPVIRPASEMKLSDLADFMHTSLPSGGQHSKEENKGK